MIEDQCTGNGLCNCACNFINACNYDASNNIFEKFSGSANDLKKLTPNVKFLSTPPNHVAEICEPGNIGIIYDCTNRIPLAATAVLTANQYRAKYTRPPVDFKRSEQIGVDFQQNKKDYTKSKQRVPCYKTMNGHYFIEQEWYQASSSSSNSLHTSSTQPCPQSIKKTPIHKGHLIAASYGRPDRREETFVYTNAVPQFERLNSGSWGQFEGGLIKWAKDNCMGAPLHVIVGTIPSTYGPNEPRFFGQTGFSNFDGISKKYSYRVNVPAFMWTAACCHSTSPLFTKSTAFFAPNRPGYNLVRGVELSKLFLEVDVRAAVDLFPGMQSCNEDKNYIQIKRL
jgi:DNA/RNA endonuclease G (NUC1)